MGRVDSMKTQQDLAEATNFSGEQGTIFLIDYPEFKTKVGDNYIKILPPKDYKENADSPFGLHVYFHWEGNDRGPVLCPKRMKNVMKYLIEDAKVLDKIPEEVEEGKCPICEEQSRVYALTGGEKEHPLYKLSTRLHPREKLLLFIVDTSSDTEIEKGVQMYLAPPEKVWKEGIYPITQPRRGRQAGEAMDISHPDNKKDVYIHRAGKGQYDTVYSGFELVDSELKIEEVKDAIEDLPNGFLEMLNLVAYEDIVTNFTTPLAEAESTDKEESPSSGRRRSRRTSEESGEGDNGSSESRRSRGSDDDKKEEPAEDEEKSKVKEGLKRKFRRRTNPDG